jgi:1,4-alpha-glucan branching enzyme
MSRAVRAATSLLLCVLVLGGCDRGKSHNPSGTQTTRFTRHGPKAVFLAGQFKDWSPIATPMRRDGTDRWVANVPLSPGKYEYKFVVNGQWEQDTSNPWAGDYENAHRFRGGQNLFEQLLKSSD